MSSSESLQKKVEDELHHVAHLVHDLPFNRRFRTVSLATFIHGVLYFSANHWPLSEPRLLEMTALDTATPFLPFTIFPYLSAYALVFVAFLSLRREANGIRFLQVFISCVVVAGLIHWTMPTRYPRELFPLTDAMDPLSRAALAMLRAFDTPNSCLPSLHVASSMASAMAVRRERPRLSWGLLAWATIIAISTLTTKQHYVVDVVSGIILALVSIGLVDFINARRAGVLAALKARL